MVGGMSFFFHFYFSCLNISSVFNSLYGMSVIYDWSQTGSNRRPSVCKTDALPTELWPLQEYYYRALSKIIQSINDPIYRPSKNRGKTEEKRRRTYAGKARKNPKKCRQYLGTISLPPDDRSENKVLDLGS